MKPYDEATVAEYTSAGYWDDEALAQRIRTHAMNQPDALAFADETRRLTWREYDEQSTRLAAELAGYGLEAGDFLGVLLPDGPEVHVVYVAAEKAGLIVVGIGPRSRVNEIHHMFEVTGCRTILTERDHRNESAELIIEELNRRGCAVERHFVLEQGDDGPVLSLPGVEPGVTPVDVLAGRALGPNDLFLVNSTSGTTGLPKCVMQTQNRWKYFHQLAADGGELTSSDVFMSLIPAPYGFGLWTAHFSPALLGCPAVVLRHFDIEQAFRAIERHRVTVLCCVSTQFVMMLNSPAFDEYDLSSLRAMFTGGERVPTTRSEEWETRTGSFVLQFYGSNESGAATYTTTRDSQEQRLTTAGRIIDNMHVKLFDPASGEEVAGPGVRGVCAVKGPAMTPGYYADPEANRKLFRKDGWLLSGDLCEIDGNGYLSVVGRESDFIIRGGQNISAHAVEEAVETHPRIGVAGVVAMADEVYGERACAFVETKDGGPIELDELRSHLDARGFSKYMWPERLVLLDTVPRGANGKVDKAGLRAWLELEARQASPLPALGQ
jgi:acyl-CoA synthetase